MRRREIEANCTASTDFVMVMKKNQRLIKIGDPDNNSKERKKKITKKNQKRKMEVQKQRMVHTMIERTV